MHDVSCRAQSSLEPSARCSGSACDVLPGGYEVAGERQLTRRVCREKLGTGRTACRQITETLLRSTYGGSISPRGRRGMARQGEPSHQGSTRAAMSCECQILGWGEQGGPLRRARTPTTVCTNYEVTLLCPRIEIASHTNPRGAGAAATANTPASNGAAYPHAALGA